MPPETPCRFYQARASQLVTACMQKAEYNSIYTPNRVCRFFCPTTSDPPDGSRATALQRPTSGVDQRFPASRQDNNTAECHCADARLDGDRGAEADQRAEQGLHEYVDHRPAPDPAYA